MVILQRSDQSEGEAGSRDGCWTTCSAVEDGAMEDTGPVPVRLSGVRGRACRHARGPQGLLQVTAKTSIRTGKVPKITTLVSEVG